MRENLDFWAGLFAYDSDAATALDRFGIAHLADLPARHLSAGQRRRLTLARLAIGDASTTGPRLWLLDEPATGLDDAAIAMLADCVLAHLAADGIAVIASHGGALDTALAVHTDRLDLAPFTGRA